MANGTLTGDTHKQWRQAAAAGEEDGKRRGGGNGSGGGGGGGGGAAARNGRARRREGETDATHARARGGGGEGLWGRVVRRLRPPETHPDRRDTGSTAVVARAAAASVSERAADQWTAQGGRWSRAAGNLVGLDCTRRRGCCTSANWGHASRNTADSCRRGGARRERSVGARDITSVLERRSGAGSSRRRGKKPPRSR